MKMDELLQDLQARKEDALRLGGEKKVERQHQRNKLTCRERIEGLLDPGTFEELGILAQSAHFCQEKLQHKRTPADGVVTGFGKIGGRFVAVAAYDFTVLGGSMGQVGEKKMTRWRELALRDRIPLIWLIDSAGARIHETAFFPAGFADTGYLFREQAVMSGVVPQVCALMGPGAAGTAYIPGLADFVLMVKGTSHMALGGPPLVKAATGEEVDEEELGGSRVHCEVSGVADLEVEDDLACLQAIRRYLSYFPSHCQQKPPVVSCDDPVDRAEEELLRILPDNPRRPYDMYRVIELLVDGGEYFDIKPKWAKNIITCLARIGGYPLGIVANQPKHWGGILDIHAADKAARFITLCDAFQIPLLFLQDVPGFMVGTKAEREGIIRHGAKMLYAVSNATVAKITVVIRKAYGAGYYVMNGRAYEPEAIYCWPTAEISVMGPEGMVGILARSELKGVDEETKQAMLEKIRQMIHPLEAAKAGLVDDVIDPRHTRLKIFRALERSWDKRIERPYKKHGVFPV